MSKEPTKFGSGKKHYKFQFHVYSGGSIVAPTSCTEEENVNEPIHAHKSK